jgi:hypothetical protein
MERGGGGNKRRESATPCAGGTYFTNQMELLAVDVDGGEVEMERKQERGRPQKVLRRSFYWIDKYISLLFTFWFAF